VAAGGWVVVAAFSAAVGLPTAAAAVAELLLEQELHQELQIVQAGIEILEFATVFAAEVLASSFAVAVVVAAVAETVVVAAAAVAAAVAVVVVVAAAAAAVAAVVHAAAKLPDVIVAVAVLVLAVDG